MTEDLHTGDRNKNYLVKLCILGDQGVGKSTIIRRFAGVDPPEEGLKPSLGLDFYVGNTIIKDGNEEFTITSQLWRYNRQVTSSRFYTGCFAVIIVFDLTNLNSFENIDSWLQELDNASKLNSQKADWVIKMEKRLNHKAEIPIVLVGNKSDLVDKANPIIDESQITYKLKGLNSKYLNKVKFFKTNSVTGSNTQQVLEYILQTVYQVILKPLYID